MVLRGAKGNDPYIGYVPVTNKEYASFKSSHTYPNGHDNDARAGGEGYENVGFRVVREISE